MAQFLAVYTGTPEARAASGWEALPAEEIRAREAKGMADWGAWMERNAHRIVLAGGPLGRTKRASAAGIDDVRNNLVGFVVIEAEDHAQAAALFADHPHFSIFPGDGVEIMECLPVPTR